MSGRLFHEVPAAPAPLGDKDMNNAEVQIVSTIGLNPQTEPLRLEDLENKIINADCMDILRRLPDKCVDLVLTDPPYGIGIDGQKQCKCSNPKHNRKEHIRKEWDSSIPPKEIFEEIKRVSKNMIVWGVNYFNEYLEQGHKGWIVWDKGQDGLTMSDCEIAYSSFDYPTRIIRLNRVELLKDGTIHPTQKPLRLFQRCIAEYSKENDLILDCFFPVAVRQRLRAIGLTGGLSALKKTRNITKQALSGLKMNASNYHYLGAMNDRI